MTNKFIKPAIQFLPEKQAESDLFKSVAELVDLEVDKFAAALNDVASKYTDPSSVTREVVTEVFKENGLKSVVDLLNGVTVVDYNTVLAFSAYITLLKGSRSGYETVLRLIGFEYTLVEWWEENGSGIPNTFSIDINLNASVTPKPFETFQQFKKFTSEYVFPIISPLGYTYVIEFDGPQIACHAAVQQTINSLFEDSSTLTEELWGPSNWIVTDTAGQNWVVKVNSAGVLKAFKTEREAQVQLDLLSDIQDPFALSVDELGNVGFDVSTITKQQRRYVKLMDSTKTNWFIYITGFGELIVSQTFVTFDSLLTEDFSILLQESGGILGL